MRFKELLIALLMTILFLCMPVTQAVSYDEVQAIHTHINTVSPFKIQLSEEQMNSLNDFICRLPSYKDQNIARSITNQILSNEELDVNRFGEMLREYGYENISNYQETTDITDDVLNFIMELIIDRLGWVYDFLEKTKDVLYDAQQLWQDRSLPEEITIELERLINNLKELQNLTTLLIEGKYFQFLRAWTRGMIIEDITVIIQSIEIIAIDFGILVGDLSRFITDIGELMNWLNDTPWEHPIHVYGRVMISTTGLSNVTIRCRGMTSFTDEEGNFSFFVNSTPNEHSIPPDVYYGIHQCVITVEYNETIKETPAEFSYVFSDGGIYWLFLLDDDSDNMWNTKLIHFHRIGLRSWICLKNIKDMLRRYLLD